MNIFRYALQALNKYGIKGVIRIIPSLIYSKDTLWLLKRTWNADEDVCPIDKSGVIFKEANLDDLENLAKTFPKELYESHWNKENIHKVLQSRFARGYYCFVAYKGNSLLSSHWCVPCEDHTIPYFKKMSTGSYESISGNTVPSARGKGIFVKLLLFTMKSMMCDRGKSIQYGRIKPQRKAAIRALEKAGFNRIGLLTSGVIFGFPFSSLDKSNNNDIIKSN